MIVTTKLWDHQQAIADFMVERPYALIAAGMRTGKTLASYKAIADAGFKKVLVITTKKGIQVWYDEYHRFVVNAEVLQLGEGTTDQKAEQVKRFVSDQETVKIVIVNYESAWRGKLFTTLAKVGFDAIILDESHKIKGNNTQVSKNLYRLGKTIKRRYALTGTPLPNSPLDIFGQARFLDDKLYALDGKPLLRSFTAFRDRYAITYPLGAGIQAIRGFKNIGELRDIMNGFTLRVEASDVFDLPERKHIRYEFDLPDDIMQVYKTFAKEAYAEFEAGIMTADNVLVKTLRLQQLTGGFFVADKKAGIKTAHTEKVEQLTDIVLKLGSEPIVIFAKFTEEIKAIQEMLKQYGKVGVLTGWQNDLAEWQQGQLQYIVVQIATGAEAISLVRAKHFVYFSNTHSLGVYEQSLARGDGSQQTSGEIFYHHLVARNTIDEIIYEALKDKTSVNSSVLSHIQKFKKG